MIATALAKEPERALRELPRARRAALAVAVDEASRLLADVAARAAAGRSELSEVEAELAGTVIDLQLGARAGARPRRPVRPGAAAPPRASARSRGWRASSRPTPTTSSAASGCSPSSSPASPAPRFLGIVGPSGSGKSSVLRAGLLPALAGGVLPGSERWRRLLLRPGERPLEELRRVLASGAKDPVAEALDALPAGERLLLAVDQLEELFTACRSDEERAAFVDALARAAADPDGRAVVVVALRADFYGRFAAYPALAELLGANHVLVGPMQASELRRARRAARRHGSGLRVEPELTDALIDDVEGEPGALPLLSTALLELWQKRHDGTLTLAAYRESGRRPRRGRAAGRGHLRPRPGRAQAARAGDHAAPGRRGRGRRAGAPPGAARRARPGARTTTWRSVLATLADSRLVTVGGGHRRGRARGAAARVAAPARVDRGGRRGAPAAPPPHRRRRRLGRGRPRPGRALPRRPPRRRARLERRPRVRAERARARVRRARAATAAERETKRARRTNRRLRGLLAGVAVLLAAAVVGRLFAVVQRGEARDAETAQLAQRLGAQALVEEDLDLSLLLARQAVAIDDTPQTRSSLLAALLRAPAASGSCTAPTTPLFWALRSARTGRRSRSPTSTAGSSSSTPGPTSRSASRCRCELGRERRLQPGRGDARARRRRRHRPSHRRAHARAAGRGRRPGGRAARIAFTSDGPQLVVCSASDLDRSASSTRPPWSRSGRRSSWRGSAASYIQSYCRLPTFALTPDGRSLITASDARRAGVVGSARAGARRARSPIATGLSRARAQPGRSHRGRRHRRGHPVGRRADGRGAHGDGGLSPGARTGCGSARTARRSCRRTSTGR